VSRPDPIHPTSWKGSSPNSVCSVLDRIESEQPNYRSVAASQAYGIATTSWVVHKDAPRRWLLRASTLLPRPYTKPLINSTRGAPPSVQQGSEPELGGACKRANYIGRLVAREGCLRCYRSASCSAASNVSLASATWPANFRRTHFNASKRESSCMVPMPSGQPIAGPRASTSSPIAK
jgi:hypothetical protein